MIVRSHLPWPLRWVVVALMFGFSAALAAWAFEVGKGITGLDSDAKAELSRLRAELVLLSSEREKALSVANTADSLLRAERAAQARLAAQIKQVEAENLSLKGDLGFFERLLPSGAGEGLSIRSLQAEAVSPGQLRFQVLVMQAGKTLPEFNGRYEVSLTGTLDGKPWRYTAPGGAQPVHLKQYLRLDGMLDHPAQAVVKTVEVKVMDTAGVIKASQESKV